VLTGGAGARAMASAFEDVFGVRQGLAGIPMAGRTDAWILQQAATTHQVAFDTARARLFRESYLAKLATEVHEPGPRKGIMPGVRELLDQLRDRDDVYLALLTGNLESGARVKLEYFDLWRYFQCGAFGDDVHDRNKLLEVALERVRASGGPSRPSEVIVVGDTPLDVAVAKAGGARSIAVATGGYDAATLAATGADIVLENFSDLVATLTALGLSPR
jgi:phosphoglycolate phosphatase-like HAD superfamily hydrolase